MLLFLLNWERSSSMLHLDFVILNRKNHKIKKKTTQSKSKQRIPIMKPKIQSIEKKTLPNNHHRKNNLIN